MREVVRQLPAREQPLTFYFWRTGYPSIAATTCAKEIGEGDKRTVVIDDLLRRPGNYFNLAAGGCQHPRPVIGERSSFEAFH